LEGSFLSAAAEVAFRNKAEIILGLLGIAVIEGPSKTQMVISNSCCRGFIGDVEGNLQFFEGGIIFEGSEGCGMGRQHLD
jgi:hypothetical protein